MYKKNKLPLISIALATHNGGRYIYKQLESIAKQSYKNIELVICDDASSDNTLEVINSFKGHLKISIFRNDAVLGVIKNFEKAISICKGDFIALCDQDDIWEINKIQKLLNEIKNYDLICSDASIIDSSEKKVANSWISYQLIEIPSERNQFQKIAFQNYALGCTILFSSDLVEHIIPIPIQAKGHDWWIALIAATKGKIKFIKDCLVQKRLHSSNVSILSSDTFLKRFINYFSSRGRNLNRKHFDESIIRIKYYLEKRIFGTPEEEKYLNDLLAYYSSYFSNSIHITPFLFAIKYKNILYENYSHFSKMIHIIAKLFSKF